MRNLDVAIYLRKSRADVEEEQKAHERGQTHDTLGKHRRELLALSKQSGHNVVDIFEELVSGEFISSRPQMQTLLDNVKIGKYEAVIVADIDRLGRGNKIDQGRIENAFRESGTLIITPSQIFDLTDENGEFSVEVRTFLANMEYRSIKRRMQKGLLNSAAAGKEVGSNAPYGYLKDNEMRLVIDEEKAAVIRNIFEWCVAGIGVRFIRHRLHEMGIPSPTGNEFWGTTMIKRVIANKKYAGYMIFGKRQHVRNENGNYVSRQRRDDSKYIEVPNAHEAIVDIELWESAQESMKSRDPRVNAKKRLVYPLAGLVKCAKCDRLMRCQAPSNRDHKYLYCGNELCNQHGIRLDFIEHAVIREISAIFERVTLEHDDISGNSLEDARRRVMKRLAQAKRELSKDSEKISRIYESYEDGIYTKEMFVERLSVAQERQRANENLIRELNEELENVEERKLTQREIIPAIGNVLELYNRTDSADHKNRLLKTVVDKIVYNRETASRKRSEPPSDFEVTIYLVE